MITQLNLRNTVEIIFRRRRTFLGAMGVALALYGGLVLTKDRKYESEASVIAKISDQDVATPDAVVTRQAQGALSVATLAQSLLNSEILVFKSTDVLGVALEKAGGAETVYPGITEKAARKEIPVVDLAIEQLIKKDLEVKVNAETNIILLSLLNVNAAVAKNMLASLIAAAIEKQADITHASRVQFLEGKLESLRKQAEAAQQQLEDFRTKNNISSLVEEKTLLLQQRDQLQANLNEASATLVSGESRLSILRQQLARTPESVPLSDENDKLAVQIDNAQARLAAAEADYSAARQRFAEGNPELVDARVQYDLAKKNFEQLNGQSDSRIRSGANPVYQQLLSELATGNADVNGARATIHERQSQIQAIQARLAFLDSHESDVHELENRRDATDQDYRSYLGQTGSARILSDMNLAGITTLSVVQSPTLPYKYGYPKRLLLLALALVAGLTCGLALCIALESSSDTIALPEHVRPLTGLPVLLTVDFRGSQ